MSTCSNLEIMISIYVCIATWFATHLCFHEAKVTNALNLVHSIKFQTHVNASNDWMVLALFSRLMREAGKFEADSVSSSD